MRGDTRRTFGLTVSKEAPPRGAEEQSLERAIARRDALRARITFWERWRVHLALPTAFVGLGLGWFPGHGLRLLLNLDPKADWLFAVLGMVAIGRAVSLYFEPRQLEVAQRAVQRLQSAKR